MRYSGKLLGAIVVTVLWMPAAEVVVPERTYAQAEQSAITPQTFQGQLDQDSQIVSQDGSFYNAHTFEGKAGQVTQINMESNDFDAFLWLFAPDGSILAQNDDFSGTNSRIVITLPTTGTYTLWANSYGRDETGRYTLAIQPFSPEEVGVAARLAEADRLFQQGIQQFNVSQFREALQSWQGAMELYRDPVVQSTFPQESRQGEGAALGSLGNAYADLGQYQEAIALYEKSLMIAREIGDHRGEGAALGSLGNAYVHLGQYQQAIALYEQSLMLAREIGDRQGESNVLVNLGIAYANLGQYQEAIALYEQSLTLAREIGNRQGEGVALGNLGNAYRDLGQYQQAIALYEQRLAIAREIGNRQGEGAALVNLGTAYANLGQYQEAIALYEQSLMLAREIGNRQGEGAALGNLGNAYRDLGQYQQAIVHHEQHFAIAREIGDRQGESNALGSLGLAYANLGQYQQAIVRHEQSLGIFREIGDRQGEGAALGSLGNAYARLGQYQQAIALYEQSLTIDREIGDRAGEGRSLGSLGVAYAHLGQYQEASTLHEQSLEIAREIGDRQSEGIALGNLGNAYADLGQYQQASALHEQQLIITREIGDRAGEGRSLGSLGVTYARLGQYQEAIALFEQQLIITREIGDRQGVGNGLSNLGSAYYALRQFSASTDAFLEAIAIFDTLRTADLPDAEKITFFDTYLDTYLNLQRSLVAQNEPEQALIYGERGRARAFVELLSTRITNNGDLNLASLESIDSLDLSEIQRVAKEQNATLVNYSVISDRSLFIWVVQPTGEIAFQQVDLGDRNLTELVSLVRETLGARSQDRATIIAELTPAEAERRQAQRQQQLQQLHQLLIEPIAQSLPTDPTQRVIFIPHQDLFLVPFAALVDGNGDYLIENHTILTAPSIQVLDLTYQKAIANNARSDRPTNSLIVGNPIMPSVWDPQTNETQQLSSLPGAEREALAIAKALDTNALLSGSASKATVMAQMPNARIIHLATHGLLEYGSPEDSGVLDVPGAIALAPAANESGLLTAAEILQMNLNAELVVLSACDTGRGRITGDGVIGLSRAFVTAGVPSLMVSLWAVDDDATAEWMVTFYDQWQETGDKAQAVRQAMLTTMENHPDPRLWAAFTLIGAAE